MADLKPIADALIAAYDTATTLPPITADAPDFSVADGYAVLRDIETRRRAQGWRPVGPQDRLHQPHDLAALRRVSADVGARLDAHRAFRARTARRRCRCTAWCSRGSSRRWCSS